MNKLIGNLLIILGILGGLYVGGWLMFIKPILYACRAFDEGILTGTIVGITILKCIFAGSVGTIIVQIGVRLGVRLMLK